jgi:hypothetical protein
VRRAAEVKEESYVRPWARGEEISKIRVSGSDARERREMQDVDVECHRRPTGAAERSRVTVWSLRDVAAYVFEQR